MRILQINTVYDTGSTGRIVAGLYNEALKSGYDPYAAFSRSDLPEGTNGYTIGNKVDFMCHVAQDILFDESGFGSKKETEKFLKWVDEIKPDIIHLHNIHGFYLQIEILFDYIKKKNIPVVWTLHDCWPVTGHCASFDYLGCNKWKTGCKKCPQHLQSYPYSIIDKSEGNYLRKKKAFSNVSNMVIVTPSKWLSDIVKMSFLKDYSVKIIPNGIDMEQFNSTHDGLVLSSEKRQIILGVANVWTKRKGLKCFEELAGLIDHEKFVVYLVGVNSFQKQSLKTKFENRIVGIQHTSSTKELAELYSRALCFVNMTLEDNFPTTNLEALACGTPVITFRTGGSPEAIDETCGYVVKKNGISQVYEKIIEVSNRGKARYTEKCRAKALSYSESRRFLEYMQVYKNACSNTTKHICNHTSGGNRDR